MRPDSICMKFIQRQGGRKGGQSAILSSGKEKHFRSIVVWGTSLVHLWKQEDCYQSLKDGRSMDKWINRKV